MKAVIIQPPYSNDTSFSDEYFEFKMNMLYYVVLTLLLTDRIRTCALLSE